MKEAFAGIIHTVGPYWKMENCEEMLEKCYRNIAKCARENSIATVASIFLSTGVKCVPLEMSVRAAAKVIGETDHELDWEFVVQTKKVEMISREIFDREFLSM